MQNMYKRHLSKKHLKTLKTFEQKCPLAGANSAMLKIKTCLCKCLHTTSSLSEGLCMELCIAKHYSIWIMYQSGYKLHLWDQSAGVWL